MDDLKDKSAFMNYMDKMTDEDYKDVIYKITTSPDTSTANDLSSWNQLSTSNKAVDSGGWKQLNGYNSIGMQGVAYTCIDWKHPSVIGKKYTVCKYARFCLECCALHNPFPRKSSQTIPGTNPCCSLFDDILLNVRQNVVTDNWDLFGLSEDEFNKLKTEKTVDEFLSK